MSSLAQEVAPPLGATPGHLTAVFRQQRFALTALALLSAIALLSIAGPFFSNDPYAQVYGARLPAGGAHWLGTDNLGRDVFSRVLLAGRYSLGIAAAATVLAVVVGLVLGTVSGYVGGKVDGAIMRFVDLTLAFPSQFLILALAVMVSVNVLTLVLIIGAFGWMQLARIVRAETLQLRTLDFVTAARSLGVSERAIVARHILPHALRPILVSSTFIFAAALFTEATLGFLGFGLSPETPTWGTLLESGRERIYDAPLLAIVPGVLLTLTILSVNVIGDALGDATDPRGGSGAALNSTRD